MLFRPTFQCYALADPGQQRLHMKRNVVMISQNGNQQKAVTVHRSVEKL